MGPNTANFDLSAIWDQFYHGVMITDASGRILYFNPIQARIDDLDPDSVLGQRVTDLYRVDEGLSPTMVCLQSGRAVNNLACFYRTRLGKVVNSIHHVYPLHEGGKLKGAICFITDYPTVEQTLATISDQQPQKGHLLKGRPGRVGQRSNLQNGTRYRFDDMVGRAADLLAARKAAEMAAQSPSPIMLCGETGTGKELFAQSIHNAGPRQAMAYVGINCATIPENLLEGMLFGTTRGAFTGAVDKPGLLERAAGGTFLLDEINAMPIGLQAKLLRVVQEKRVRRIGAAHETDIDVKFISAITCEPHQAIENQTLRSDLFYRLGVVLIRIPPLRERLIDLESLAAHFIECNNAMLGTRVETLSREIWEMLRAHDWPGNVRELAHIIEGAMNLVGRRQQIETGDLAFHFRPQARRTTAVDAGMPWAAEPLRQASVIADRKQRPESDSADCTAAESKGPQGLQEIQDAAEIGAIRAVLEQTAGNAARAARRLKISPQRLHYKLKKHDIDATIFRSQPKSGAAALPSNHSRRALNR